MIYFIYWSGIRNDHRRFSLKRVSPVFFFPVEFREKQVACDFHQKPESAWKRLLSLLLEKGAGNDQVLLLAEMTVGIHARS